MYPENIGKHGKGAMNSNGEYLAEFIKTHNFLLSNTVFYHRLSHRTTWTAPEKIEEHRHHDGSTRRNPYRNQIDYIAIQTQHRQLLVNIAA